jgi:hypothetical protein
LHVWVQTAKKKPVLTIEYRDPVIRLSLKASPQAMFFVFFGLCSLPPNAVADSDTQRQMLRLIEFRIKRAYEAYKV